MFFYYIFVTWGEGRDVSTSILKRLLSPNVNVRRFCDVFANSDRDTIFKRKKTTVAHIECLNYLVLKYNNIG